MKALKIILFFFSLQLCVTSLVAQPRVKVVSGLISLDDFAPTQMKYAGFQDSLDRALKIHPNDTTSLFYRALLSLQFNRFIINPDVSTPDATIKLLVAKRMVDRADSLKMKNINLKILRAQICQELTTRYAPLETWKFNARQLAQRRKKFDYYKDLANKYYDELAVLDQRNAYYYGKLKVKD